MNCNYELVYDFFLCCVLPLSPLRLLLFSLSAEGLTFQRSGSSLELVKPLLELEIEFSRNCCFLSSAYLADESCLCMIQNVA